MLRIMQRRRLMMMGIAALLLLTVAGAFLVFGGWVGVSAQSTSGPSAGTTTAPTDYGPAFITDQAPGGPTGVCGPHAGGKVTAINGNSLTVQTKDGSTITVNVTGSTTIERAGVKSSLSAIHVNDYIAVRGTQSGNNTIQATAISILLPRVGGMVTKVTDSTITVTTFDGTTQTIKVDSNTRYQRADKSASLSDIKEGMRIVAEGTQNSDGSLQAERIVIQLPRVFGQVSAVNGSNITVTSFFGETRTVVTSGSTSYVQGDGTKTDASAVKVGVRILAEGTLSSDGKTLNAERIVVLPAGRPGGFGFRRDFGFHGLDGGVGFGLRGFRGFAPGPFQGSTLNNAPARNT